MRFIFLHWIISKYFLFLFRCFRVIGLEALSCTTHKIPTRGSCPQQVSFFPSLWFSEILLSIANSLVVRFLKNTEKRCGDRFSVQSFSIAESMLMCFVIRSYNAQRAAAELIAHVAEITIKLTQNLLPFNLKCKSINKNCKTKLRSLSKS